MRKSHLAVVLCAVLSATLAADAPWKWSGSFGDKAVELLILGDIQIHSRRADPTTAFHRMRDTLKRADLIYANLEGLLVKSVGDGIDIADKKWTHPGPDGVKGLKAANIAVVGVANNVASGRDNIMKSLAVLDAHGILHTGAGANIDEAHRPAIVTRKGVRIGFLQYTARWYKPQDMIATATEAGVAKITSLDGLTIDPADLARVKRDIAMLRPLVDIVVVSHHNRDGSTDVQFGSVRGTSAVGRDRARTEEYQTQFARAALDTGADFVFGHGTHTIQGAEIYKDKPILYAIGHSTFDQPGYEKSTDGLVARVVIEGKQIRRVSFVPVTRDAGNDVYLLDPSAGEGAKLVQWVKDRSASPPAMRIDGKEVVVFERGAAATHHQ